MIVIAILGLWLPGYALARALRAPMAWAAAFPLSAVLLTEVVTAFTPLSIPISFQNVLWAILAVTLVAAVVSFLRRKSESEARETIVDDAPLALAPKALLVIVAVQVALVLLGILVRTTLCPLSGFDTPFRWDHLARLMCQYESLSFYPPVSADDFSKYTYPDGMPPLVSTVYWWLYAGRGEPCPAITSVAVFLQAASCFALVFLGAQLLFGTLGGWVALGVLSSSSLFLSGVMIGQETGYTALAFAGQLAFGFAAVRRPKAGPVVIAGLFAALGALSREYGPLLAGCGFAVLACHRQTWRYLPLFCLVTAVFGAPWYVRNWVLTGNPVYPMDILGFPSNSIHAGIIKMYQESSALHLISADKWRNTATTLATGSLLALLVGVPSIAAAGKKGVVIGLCAGAAVLIWLWSIPYTKGNIDYTMRLLTPAWVALSMVAGCFASQLVRPAEKRKALLLVGAPLLAALCGGYAVLACWSHPLGPRDIRRAITYTVADPLDSHEIVVTLAKELEGKPDLPATGVLTNDSFLAVAIKQRTTRFHPVMAWSPEVAFVFDPQWKPDEVRRRLIAMNVRVVAVGAAESLDKFLRQFPFFGEDKAHWQPIETAVSHVRRVFFLPSHDDQSDGDEKDELRP